MGLDSVPQAMVSHRRLLSRAVTPAGGSFIVLMEPDKAQRRVPEMIKGLTTGRQRVRSGKTRAGGAVIKVRRESSRCPAPDRNRTELPHGGREKAALFRSHRER